MIKNIAAISQWNVDARAAYPVDSGFPRCSVLSDRIGAVARADTDGEGSVARGVPEVVSRRGELRGFFIQVALKRPGYQNSKPFLGLRCSHRRAHHGRFWTSLPMRSTRHWTTRKCGTASSISEAIFRARNSEERALATLVESEIA